MTFPEDFPVDYLEVLLYRLRKATEDAEVVVQGRYAVDHSQIRLEGVLADR